MFRVGCNLIIPFAFTQEELKPFFAGMRDVYVISFQFSLRALNCPFIRVLTTRWRCFRQVAESRLSRGRRLLLCGFRSESLHISPLQVHEYLRSKLCSLYENDCIFDKFECCWNGNDRYRYDNRRNKCSLDRITVFHLNAKQQCLYYKKHRMSLHTVFSLRSAWWWPARTTTSFACLTEAKGGI